MSNSFIFTSSPETRGRFLRPLIKGRARCSPPRPAPPPLSLAPADAPLLTGISARRSLSPRPSREVPRRADAPAFIPVTRRTATATPWSRRTPQAPKTRPCYRRARPGARRPWLPSLKVVALAQRYVMVYSILHSAPRASERGGDLGRPEPLAAAGPESQNEGSVGGEWTVQGRRALPKPGQGVGPFGAPGALEVGNKAGHGTPLGRGAPEGGTHPRAQCSYDRGDIVEALA